MFANKMRAHLAARFVASQSKRFIPKTGARYGIKTLMTGVATGAVVGGFTFVSCAPAKVVPPPFDLDAVRADIEDIIDDDFTKGPQFVRLAWHEAGTWDKASKTGSPNTASMRFKPECTYGANNGLDKPRAALEKLKAKYPQMSYADLWSLAGCVAVEKMGGPHVTWRWGRVDAKDGSACGPDGRLPDGSKTQNHVREIFYRMGFNDEEIVALIGAHTVGECRLESSGFVGPWTHDKYGFDNTFFVHLLSEKWEINPKVENLQFMDEATNSLMMLPADMAFLLDPKFRAISEKFANDNDAFSEKFAKAYQKLLELGTTGLKNVE